MNEIQEQLQELHVAVVELKTERDQLRERVAFLEKLNLILAEKHSTYPSPSPLGPNTWPTQQPWVVGPTID
jgi:hypothetical protein